jgi:hypothetical protein
MNIVSSANDQVDNLHHASLSPHRLETRAAGPGPMHKGYGMLPDLVIARRESGRGRPTTRDGVPNGIRTRVATLKGLCPRPLDDGDAGSDTKMVELVGIEPTTSCMPCKRSPS